MLTNRNFIFNHVNLNYLYKETDYIFLNNKLSSDILNFSNSEFKVFFKKLGINIPQVLNKTKSIHRLHSTNSLSVFPKYLSRHGMKVKSRKLVLMSILKYLNLTPKSNIFFWKVLFLNLTSFFVCSKRDPVLFFDGNVVPNSIKSNLKSILSTNFNMINLIFSFYIYKVDKHIYKNSRGRSGKFTFIWKYIAPYKRISRITYWLLKDVKTAAGKTLKERLDIVLHNFIKNPYSSLAWKIKRFSLNYGYYNLRHSLLETYRTSAK